MSAHKQKGFTLIELLVVIAILAILASIGFVTFDGVQKGARDTKRKADLHAISLALEQYKLINGRYPNSNYAGSGGWGDSSVSPNAYIAGLSSSFSGGTIPVDPVIMPLTSIGITATTQEVTVVPLLWGLFIF